MKREIKRDRVTKLNNGIGQIDFVHTAPQSDETAVSAPFTSHICLPALSDTGDHRIGKLATE